MSLTVYSSFVVLTLRFDLTASVVYFGLTACTLTFDLRAPTVHNFYMTAPVVYWLDSFCDKLWLATPRTMHLTSLFLLYTFWPDHFTATMSLENDIKMLSLKSLSLFFFLFFLHISMWKVSMKIHSIKSRFVTGVENILFAAICVCTFQPKNLTG